MLSPSVRAYPADFLPREQSIGCFAPTRTQRWVVEFIRRFGLGIGALRKYGARLLERLHEGPIDYDYFGLTLRFGSPIGGSARHMLLTPTWSEHQECAFIEAHLPSNGVFFDIGANTGFYTFFVAGRRPESTVISVEPMHEYVAMLQFNVRSNGLERVVIADVALSDREGLGAFNKETESMVFGSQSVSMRTTTLQRLAMTHGVRKIDCMKIDVEGMEDRVLIPFIRSAPRSLWPKALIIEHACSAHWTEDCLALLEANGYREQFRTKLNAALVLD